MAGTLIGLGIIVGIFVCSYAIAYLVESIDR